MPDALWTLTDVRLNGTDTPRLAGVSARVPTGVTAVLGPSGAGKTSLLNLLVGFESSDAGTVVASMPSGSAIPVMWVPQGGGLWPHVSAIDHLLTVQPEPGLADAESLLAELDLLELASTLPGEMSAGERARLAVARALAGRPAVLVMDEPLAHVDRARRADFWAVVRDRARAMRASLVFSTHSPEMVLGEAESVLCLRGGRLVYDGPVSALYDAPETREQAECLGRVNWITPDEAPTWLGSSANGRSCYRPEHITVAEQPDGPLLVRSWRFRGAVAEAELEHCETGRVRSFVHRTDGRRLREGLRVMMRAVFALMVIAVATGCGGADGSTLNVRNVSAWTVPAEGTRVPMPRAVAVGYSNGAEEIYTLDTAGRLVVYGPDGEELRRWSMPDSRIGTAEGICVLRDGRIAVADTHYNCVRIFDSDGNLLKSIGRFDADGNNERGEDDGEFIYPVGVEQDEGGFIYVCEYGGNDRVQKFTEDGEFVLAFGRPGIGAEEFQRPSGLAWLEGRLYVADAVNHRIAVFSPQGEFLDTIGGGETDVRFDYPYDICAGPGGSLIVVDYGSGCVTAVSPQGKLLGRYGSTGRALGQFNQPWGVDVDRDGRAFVCDTRNSRMVRIDL